MQTFFRSGIISDATFAGIYYFQGLTLHGRVNAIVFTTFFAVAFGNVLVTYYIKKPLNIGRQWTSALLMIGGTLMVDRQTLSRASYLYWLTRKTDKGHL